MMALHHLAFRTADVAALASFYREMFGFEVVRDALPKSLWLALGADAVLMIEARTDAETPIAAGSMELVAFRADERTLSHVRERARERDCYDGETPFTVYVRDPDGRRIGVSNYRLRED
ncbi:MAG TPA: VOC family protein [Candidatus Limnocylindrales bacterium]|jgi:catechol 2,3-dioxygenase-like lactoylglutathione lyase family enzyme|nr:VOC family protein [Candidatus Limnocylindrales bacterium]